MNPMSKELRSDRVIWVFRGLLVVVALFLVARLAELQIIKGAYYKNLADGNRLRKVTIEPQRGNILARGGEVVAGSKEIKRTVIFDSVEGYKKVLADDNASEEEVFVETNRIYKYGEILGHVVGYLGEVNAEELGKIDPNCPEKGIKSLGSSLGRTGLERQYDCVLRGIPGEELIEVDAYGKKIRVLGVKPPQKGTDIVTTIDINLQKKLSEVMKDKKGAAIISDARGQILAIYSEPSFDPNIFVSEDKASEINKLLNDPDLPLFDRTIGGAYHPGSVFKIVTAIAALEEGEISKDFTYEDTGIIQVNDFDYTNWYFTQYGLAEGQINLPRALARSTDTFFYKIGELIGIDSLVSWASRFGAGEKTGIDLPGEVSGLLPSPQWKKAVKGERWFLGNTYHMSIGQGDLTMTPIEVSKMVTVIAANGKFCTPRLLLGEGSDCTNLNIKGESLSLVKKGMLEACSPGGTGYPFFDFKGENLPPGPQVACKTGTAEVGETDDTHAWFTAFAPVNDPQIVATIVLEKGGEGSKAAAPIIRQLFDYYFNP